MKIAIEWLKERNRELKLIFEELIPQILVGMFDFIVSWYLVFIAGSLAVVIAIFRTY